MGMLEEYLRKLAVVNATDLLLSSGRPPLYRTLDALLPLPGEGQLADAELHTQLQQWLSPDDWQTLHDQQRVTFNLSLETGQRVGGACHMAAHGLTVKLSLLGAQAERLNELELPKALARLFEAETGLIVVTGPARSGKTTLIARLISQIAAERSLCVATSECPVEYRLQCGDSSVVQRSVGRHASSHAQAIDTALATQADIIACSDLNAPEVFPRLLEAACSGVLALGELPSVGVVRTLEQLVMASPKHAHGQVLADLADGLLAVVSLDLLPRKSGGRVLAAELLLASRNVCSLIRDGKLGMLAGLLDREPGMQSMDHCLLELATRGVVDGREALGRAIDKRSFAAWA